MNFHFVVSFRERGKYLMFYGVRTVKTIILSSKKLIK